MFVDCACTKWDKTHASQLRQVTTYQPILPGERNIPEVANIAPDDTTDRSETGHEEVDMTESRESQGLGMLAGSQASLPEPIPRPRLDFEKSCERLAGLEIADRAMGMRLHIPERRITKF
jgi:hypothetical protein